MRRFNICLTYVSAVTSVESVSCKMPRNMENHRLCSSKQPKVINVILTLGEDSQLFCGGGCSSENFNRTQSRSDSGRL